MIHTDAQRRAAGAAVLSAGGGDGGGEWGQDVYKRQDRGYIVTANHAVVDEQYPYFIARDWASGDRGQRITDMIEAAIAEGPVDADDLARIHSDSYSLRAASYVPLLAGLSSDDAAVQQALDTLAAWDYQERRDSVGASLFEIFYMRLAHNVLADDVGEENISDAYSTIYFHQLAQDCLLYTSRCV